MIFDLVVLPEIETTRFKPRNKTSCVGSLYYDGEEIASLRSLTIVRDNQQPVVGGRMVIEWHRLRSPQALTKTGIDIRVTYDDRGVMQSWEVPDIQILHEGSVLGVQDFSELLGRELAFFASGLRHHV